MEEILNEGDKRLEGVENQKKDENSKKGEREIRNIRSLEWMAEEREIERRKRNIIITGLKGNKMYEKK